MGTSSFKEILAASGPDLLKLPTKSCEQRLTESMPPVVAELLEQRRLMSVTDALNGTTLEVTGSSGADFISVYIDTVANSINVWDGGTHHGVYDPNAVTLVKILAGGGNDSVYI